MSLLCLPTSGFVLHDSKLVFCYTVSQTLDSLALHFVDYVLVETLLKVTFLSKSLLDWSTRGTGFPLTHSQWTWLSRVFHRSSLWRANQVVPWLKWEIRTWLAGPSPISVTYSSSTKPFNLRKAMTNFFYFRLPISIKVDHVILWFGRQVQESACDEREFSADCAKGHR